MFNIFFTKKYALQNPLKYIPNIDISAKCSVVQLRNDKHIICPHIKNVSANIKYQLVVTGCDIWLILMPEGMNISEYMLT